MSLVCVGSAWTAGQQCVKFHVFATVILAVSRWYSEMSAASYKGFMVDALAQRSDERRGMAAISLGELPSKLRSGDF